MRALGEVVAIAPALTDLTQLEAPVVLGRRPRIVGRPEPPRGRVVEDERGRALGVRRREEQRDPRPLLRRPEHGTLGADRVHDSADVVHPRLQGGHLPHRVGEAAPSLVEEDQPCRANEPRDVIHEERHLPAPEQVGERSANEDDVGGAFTGDLIRDRDVAATGVPNVRNLHGKSVPLRRRRDGEQAPLAGHVHGRILPSWLRRQPNGSC